MNSPVLAWRVAATLFVVLAVLPCHESLAEVAVDPGANGAVSGLALMSRGGDGSDPWPWGRMRLHIDETWLLNPNGDDGPFPDGYPSFGLDPVGSTPEVTWSRHDGEDYEIVVSRWEFDRWIEPVTLTANDADDLDPEIAYAPDGTARLTFWRDSNVFMLLRAPEGGWGAPELVDAGTLPSVAGTTLDRVAYQRPATGSTEIVTAERVGGGWVPVVLGAANFAGFDGTGDLDVRLGAQGSHVWVAWEDSATLLGWSELLPGGTWSAPRYEVVAGPEDEEAARLRIKLQVLD